MAPACPQVEPRVPSRHLELLQGLDAQYDAPEFITSAAAWLGGAVRIPTESYDNQPPVGSDPRWEKFAPLHDYLLETFPQVHATLALTKVNTYGLVYHWQGLNPALKPILIAGHQDVVPVEPETADKWTHPPFSGHFDGTWIWGRGAMDDKSTLISALTAVEQLIIANFKPERTVVLAFGFDEESSGEQGALQLSIHLEQTYGPKAFALLIDEGNGFMSRDGVVLAEPAVAEKGYLDARIEINTPGGHSSIPPAHTGIGILASAIVALEASPIPVHLTRTHIIYEALICAAAHVPGSLPDDVRKDLIRSRTSDKALKRAEAAILADPIFKAVLGTTQAVDLVQGGVKVNALPETAYAIANYRINTESSVASLEKHLRSVLQPVAESFNLSFSAFEDESDGQANELKVSAAWHSGLEPAPRTPTDPDAAPYALLSGTIKSVLSHGSGTEPANVVVAPAISTGNTDTARYWNLTDHIFRYGHVGELDQQNEHTVDEAVRATAIVEYIRFFTYLILNADEAALE